MHAGAIGSQELFITLINSLNCLCCMAYIAVLKLDETVDLNVYTPICLPAMTDTWAAGKRDRETEIVLYIPICLPVMTDTWAAGKRDRYRDSLVFSNLSTCHDRYLGSW